MRLNRSPFIICLALTIFIAAHARADTVWIDVRSWLEHAADHIEGDIRISHDEIVKEVVRLFPDKSTEIRLYCRSGGRAGAAESALREAGYENVSNAGGIEDARKERGLID